MLSSRMMLILQELMAAKTTVTSNDLADRIGVTPRTIRNDIKELNGILLQSGGFIEAKRGIGYELVIENNKTFKAFLQNMTQKSNASMLPSSPEERVIYIVRMLLLNNGYIKLDDMADELYISKSTLQNDLIGVKKILTKFNLKLISKPYHGVKIIGEEMSVRFCLSEYLFNREEMLIDMQKQADFILPQGDINKIYTIILKEVKASRIEMSDIALNNLCIHIAIACKRIREENYVQLAPEDFAGIHTQTEYKVAKGIVTQIENALHVSFPKTEIAYIAIHLLGTKKIAKINVNPEEFESFVESDLRSAIKEFIHKVDEHLKLHLINDHELFIALGLHLQPTLNRLRYGMNMRNPMLDEIKTKYPLAFDAAILAREVFNKRLAIDIDEDEVGYIALHISVAMLRQKMQQDIKRCIIVCATGVGSAMLLKYRLQSKYPNQLQVVDTTDFYRLNEISLKGIDFIITTVPMERKLAVPIIYVNTILGAEDLRKIEDYLKNRTENKIDFLKEELIFLQKDLPTKEATIQYLVEKVVTAGYVDGSFGASVLKREELSPTSFGNLVAIPHPMEPYTTETFWTICTLKKPIDWEGSHVQFVCLLSIGKNNTSDLKLMYDYLIEIIENKRKVNQLLRCEERDELIETINAML
ncbi:MULTISPECIES: BglG family transcription antiterminator [Clostridia]|uniref:BglG family transcription antiterminator n=1 Tax=Clostridia TaxID=186801 RepID=UPI000EA21E0D|nr:MULTISPECIES: BglG family transcription antiterminator [Clostridia]NBJ69552.1 transcription antiterminator [Roseburia sp. 1XD42-34]RKI78624.1 transcription antiterminator [Clostridium sp. 1xD42-85]